MGATSRLRFFPPYRCAHAVPQCEWVRDRHSENGTHFGMADLACQLWALPWTLSVPLIIGMFNAFRGISEQKAPGLGAIAGLAFGLILGCVLELWT